MNADVAASCISDIVNLLFMFFSFFGIIFKFGHFVALSPFYSRSERLVIVLVLYVRHCWPCKPLLSVFLTLLGRTGIVAIRIRNRIIRIHVTRSAIRIVRITTPARSEPEGIQHFFNLAQGGFGGTVSMLFLTVAQGFNTGLAAPITLH